MSKYTNIGINYWKHRLPKKVQKIGTAICIILLVYLLASWIDVDLHSEEVQKIADWNIFKLLFKDMLT